jgi:hypothetical protein
MDSTDGVSLPQPKIDIATRSASFRAGAMEVGH